MEARIVWGSVVCKDFWLNSKWNKCIFIRFKYISFLDFIYLFYIKVSCNMTLSYMNFKKIYSFFSFSSALPLSFVTLRKQHFCSIYLYIPHVVRELYVIIVCLNLFIFSFKHDFFSSYRHCLWQSYKLLCNKWCWWRGSEATKNSIQCIIFCPVLVISHYKDTKLDTGYQNKQGILHVKREKHVFLKTVKIILNSKRKNKISHWFC